VGNYGPLWPLRFAHLAMTNAVGSPIGSGINNRLSPGSVEIGVFVKGEVDEASLNDPGLLILENIQLLI
jgi:hypothetical protein